MFERLQKPFLTVETGEAYQPIRLSYDLYDKEKLIATLDQLSCCVKNPTGLSWNWFWKGECNDLHFESLDSYKKHPDHPLRIGTLTIREEGLFINLPSFKRACIAVQFFYKFLAANIAQARNADFINKVYGIDERLPHGFTELFKDDELERIIRTRSEEYEKAHEQVALAATADEAMAILRDYTSREAKKRLPYAERYSFVDKRDQDPDVIFLGFYIFLRGRELVAIRRWFGETGYTLADAADETVGQVFGTVDIDIIE